MTSKTTFTAALGAVLLLSAGVGPAAAAEPQPDVAEPIEPLTTAPTPKGMAVSLVADAATVAPNKPFTLGVHYRIPRSWHIYWKHPGDAGAATTVRLKAPKGYAVGPLRWPRPVTFKQPGDITGYGYAGEVVLMATVTPPKDARPGARATFDVETEWLACKDKCVPGEASLGLSLPVADKPRPDADAAATIEAWRQRLNPMAPAFELTDQDGDSVSLAAYRGTVVVLEWFNPDCPFVKRHHAKRSTMVDLARKYAKKGVVWLAVNSTHYMDRAKSKQWHEKWKLPYPLLIDRDGKVGRAYGAKTTPHMFVIDPNGQIVYQGGIDDDPRGRKGDEARNHVAAALDDLLADRPVGRPKAAPYGCSVKYAKR
jgi:DsbC/DsbD-like thiol-disulfide interchange protein